MSLRERLASQAAGVAVLRPESTIGYSAYQELKVLRGALPEESSFDGLESYIGKLVRVAAFDWNCSQHITPRFTLEQLREAGVGILGA